MKMTNKLANALMDNLTCVTISAVGIPKTEKDMEEIVQYARQFFVTILEIFEEELGEKWEIEMPDDEQESDENVDK